MKASLALLSFLAFSVSLTAITNGPDSFGYSVTDSNEPDGPAFHFIDISTTGSRIFFQGTGDEGAQTVQIPAGFPFYGEVLSAIRVSTNGYLSSDLNDVGDDHFNRSTVPFQPLNGGGSRIYALHNDLVIDEFGDFPGPTGAVFTQSFTSLPEHPFKSDTAVTIIQWQNAFHATGLGSGKFTFQALLFADGNIYLSYPESDGTLQSSRVTVGIQNAAATVGVLYSAKTAGTITAPQAIAFTYEEPVPPLVITDFAVIDAASGEASLTFESTIGSAYVIESSPTLDFENPTTTVNIPASEVTTELTTKTFVATENRDFIRVREVPTS
ncbi:hypothetical protein AAFN60_09275 [Roseibacillus persicicus]|uniref:hypothetical protein n=1 Tax=Roseibacillus persicicus TaxID=454148 RepID=UPI00398B4881